MSVNAITPTTENKNNQITAGKIITPTIISGLAGGAIGATALAPKKYSTLSLIELDKDTFQKAVKEVDSSNLEATTAKNAISASRQSIDFEMDKMDKIFKSDNITIEDFNKFVLNETKMGEMKLKGSEKGIKKDNELAAKLFEKISASAKDGKINKNTALDIYKKGMIEQINNSMMENSDFLKPLEKYIPKNRTKGGLLIGAMTAIVGGSAAYIYHAKKASE